MFSLIYCISCLAIILCAPVDFGYGPPKVITPILENEPESDKFWSKLGFDDCVKYTDRALFALIARFLATLSQAGYCGRNSFTYRLLSSQAIPYHTGRIYFPTFPGTLWTIRPWSTVKFFKLVSMRDRTPYHKADWLATDLPGFSAIDLAGSLLSDDRDDKSMPT